ncbi:hypothetical protein AAG570_000402 [Ranatra chinensis]|uniref:E1 ubiquitin-activating enzyme n=1 Tax=Ranatra chinensis TaxID=642074 RepID=A0ABD0YX96_9HEMI
MQRLSSSNVLLSGLGGLGVEIAKNLILGGLKSITLHDDLECTHSDLSSQFFLSEDNIGENRAKVSASKLADLNKCVLVCLHVGSILEEEFLKKFDVVVLANRTFEDQLKISRITHSNGIRLIIASVRGVFAQVFCDFGENFTVVDKNGEDPGEFMIAGITREKESVVACLDGTKHGLEDGDYVTFSDIQGMTELNGCQPVKVKIISVDAFSIGDTSMFSPYIKGGIATQVKIPITIKFKCLEDSFVNPSFVDSPGAERSNQLHLAFCGLHTFIEDKGHFPRPWSITDGMDLLSICEDIHRKSQYNFVIDSGLIKKFSHTSAGNVSPMNALIGGIVAQEVMKACSGKFYPIFQLLYFDAVECLPEKAPDDFQAVGSRYDSQIAIFGQRFQDKLCSMNLFVVGAGGIGCEILKNAVMMGVGVGDGSVLVTDNDLVHKSNLNRQVLYRPRHVKKAKSTTAAKAVKRINPSVKMYAHANKVGPETEHIYNDDFFHNIDVVANAVDNLESRIYVDSQCVYYKKPLIDSGKLGTKGNVQVVIPFLTESYSSSRDPLEKNVPLCTINTFPNAIEHAVQWAKKVFEFFFHKSVVSASHYLTSPREFEELLSEPGVQPVEIMNSVRRALVEERPKTFDDCVRWARNTWQELFYNQIRQLLAHFPPDEEVPEGQPFWSGPKRCPFPLVFDPTDPLHVDFIISAANIRAAVYGLQQNYDREHVVSLTESISVPPFAPRMMTIELIDKLTDAHEATSQVTFKRTTNRLPDRNSLSWMKLTPLNLDVDNDSNSHLNFILAASNLRALNYQIRPIERLTAKMLAGKIIPAIATTCSVVAGLACLELFKIAGDDKRVHLYKNSFFNLAIPLFVFSEPVLPKTQKYLARDWNIWDCFEMTGEKTLREFLNYFHKRHSLIITMLTYRVCVLYSRFTNSDALKGRFTLTMTQLTEEVSKTKLNPNTKSLAFELCCVDFEGNDVEVPYVKYILPK